MLSRNVPEFPKTIQAITVASNYSAELVDMTLLLKTLHTLVTGHRERKLELGRKLPLCRVATIVPEGIMQDAGGESAAVLISCEPRGLTTKQDEFTGPIDWQVCYGNVLLSFVYLTQPRAIEKGVSVEGLPKSDWFVSTVLIVS